MQPVTVALLAALLPTWSIILILIGLSTYLFVQSRKARTKQPIQDVSSVVVESPVTVVRPSTPIVPQNFLGHHLDYSFQLDPFESYPGQCLDQRLEKDVSFTRLSGWTHHFRDELVGLVGMRTGPRDKEPWDGGEILEALGYRSLSTPSIMSLILDDRYRNRVHVFEHILFEIFFQRTSLDSRPEETFLPFAPAQTHELLVYFQELGKTQCKCWPLICVY